MVVLGFVKDGHFRLAERMVVSGGCVCTGATRHGVGSCAPTGRRTIGARVRGRKSNDLLPAAGGENFGDAHKLHDFI